MAADLDDLEGLEDELELCLDYEENGQVSLTGPCLTSQGRGILSSFGF